MCIWLVYICVQKSKEEKCDMCLENVELLCLECRNQSRFHDVDDEHVNGVAWFFFYKIIFQV